MKPESSKFYVNVTINSNQYNLQYLGCWGGPWENTPTDIEANSKKQFTLNDNNRGGIWYRAIDPSTQEEEGFVTMSFTCPKLSSNSAEGSPSFLPPGVITFIPAGLQPYNKSGSLNLIYNVGTSNEACWDSGSNNDRERPECSETTFSDSLPVCIMNPLSYQLRFGGYWNDNSNGERNWYWAPNSNDIPPPECRRTIFLKDNDAAGLFIRVLTDKFDGLGFANLSFASPVLFSMAAEGSPEDVSNGLVSAGLQKYHTIDRDNRKATYQIGHENLACWSDPFNNNNRTVRSQTTFENKRVLIIISNSIPEALKFDSFWNDNAEGASNWYVEPNSDDSIPPDCKRFFVLKDNNKAGLWFKQSWLEFHMSFTCPILSTNSAEGSPHAGLQTYSESGTPVIFNYKVGNPNLACWSSGTSNNGDIVCEQTRVLPLDLEKWMGKLNEKYPDAFKKQTLRSILIPGSHDAACYSIFNIITIPWAKTQDSNFYDQLIRGVRYLDLRPFYGGVFQEINYFHHGEVVTNSQLSDLIGQITTFYTNDWKSRQNEIIILDFTHFQNYLLQINWEFFFNEILNSTLNQYLIPQGTFNSSTTLNTLWTASTNQRVIASLSPDAYAAYQAMQGNKPNLWEGASLFAPGWNGARFWPNCSNKQDLIAFINANITTFSENSNLWVLQDILTPTPTQPVYPLVGQAREALYGPSGLTWRGLANIVIQDYYDERTTIEAIMENIKRLSTNLKS